MLIPISRKIFLVNCTEALVSQIKAVANQVCAASDIEWHASNALTQEMRGYCVIFCGPDSEIRQMTSDTAVILISQQADISLLRYGYVDVLTLPLEIDRFCAALCNMLCRAELRRCLDLRTNELDTYFSLSSDMLWTKDLRDYHMDVNHILIDLVGKPRTQIEGRHEREIYGLSPEDKGCSDSDAYVRETGKLFSSEESMPSADGQLHHLQVKKTAWRDGQNRIVGSIGLAKDVTALMNQQTKFICFLNALDSSIVITDRTGTITQANESYLSILGQTEQQVLGQNVDDLTNAAFAEADGYEPDDCVVSASHGRSIWHRNSFRLKDYWGQQTGYAYVFQNVTSEREHNLQIKRMAEHDPLTGLANRAGMYEYFDAMDKSGFASFLFIDVDNFKSVNDRFGHAVGDRFLRDLAEVFHRTRADAFVTRFGGDEFFAILDSSLSRRALGEIAETLLHSVKHLPGYPAELIASVSLSIGVLPHFALSRGIDEAVQKCDALMYQAKRSGKDRYCMTPDGECSVCSVP
jgi:diguanylate cyclase (GGDEF)-like protein/PAS domain S-box-containing protein